MSITRKKILPIVLGAVLLTGLVYGFQKVRYMMTHEDTENSYLEADIVTIAPKVSGYVEKILIEDNQWVKAGDTLFILDNRDYLLRVRQAEAALTNAEANVGLVSANAGAAGANVGTAEANFRASTAGVETTLSSVQTAQANVDAAQAKAWQTAQDFSRFAALLPQRAVTQQQYDAAKAARDNADAALQAAKAQLETARRQVEVSRRQSDAGERQTSAFQAQAQAAGKNVQVARTLVEQRQIDLDNARLNLSYTVITAPVSGFIAKRSAQPGQLANVGTPLCVIVQDQNLWITANFKETQVSNMRPDQAVQIKVDAYPGKTFNGKIQSIAPATGAKFSLLPPDNASGNFVKVVQRVPVKIVFTDPADPAFPLRAGMSVEVAVPTR
ncbi:MAG TPA: HlyD family secretion protein [Saprospiraceae bacterium]|nr:HlyD family secretion protein [Saprospiraceae bacterium]